MASVVNLDALILREDFQVDVPGTPQQALPPATLGVRELERENSFFYAGLRKPDFQRETVDWDPRKVAELIRSFTDGDLIPAIILWKHGSFNFVIDGAHRLSALVAWVQDDYGDAATSHRFFDHRIPGEQVKSAQQCRALVNRTVGAYRELQHAATNPAARADIRERALRLGSLSLSLQWVAGDAKKAEASFIRINQKASAIDATELQLLQKRNCPNAIAARAIVRRGTGHRYWANFPPDTQQIVEQKAGEVYGALFTPPLQEPLKGVEVPAAGRDGSAVALSLVYEFVNLCQPWSETPDSTGEATLETLRRCVRMASLIAGNEPRSLGLHPAVYFYSWTGKQQPVLFLAAMAWFKDLEDTGRLPEFTSHRKALEDFLVHRKTLITQVIRKFGSKTSGRTNLVMFFSVVYNLVGQGKSEAEIVEALLAHVKFNFLQPAEQDVGDREASEFSSDMKSAVVMRQSLSNALRCSICGGYLPGQSITVDHVVRRRDGGTGSVSNAALAHPYCNTGIKN